MQVLFFGVVAERQDQDQDRQDQHSQWTSMEIISDFLLPAMA
jgi:hypothetical protein